MKKGWQTKKLADLVEVQNGYAFSSKDYSESGHFLMRIGNVQNGYISTADPKFIKLPSDGSLQRFVLSEGDILVSLTGNVGRVGVVQAEHLPAALNQRVARISIRKDSPATREMLLLFLCSDWFRGELIGAGHGAAQQNVSTKDLVEIEIPVPPLAEQQRIVAILDEAFAGIATAKANTEKNLQNARAIFESYLNDVFTQRSEGWLHKPLGELCDFLNGFAFKSEDAVTASKTQLIRMGNLYGGKLDTERNSVFYPDSFADEYRRFILNEGDIIISLTGTTGKEDYGFAVKVPESDRSFLMNQRIAKFDSIREDKVNRDFLLHYLRSRAFLDKLYPTANGTRQANLSTVTMKMLPVPLCSTYEQQKIVAVLDSLSAETKRLEDIYKNKLTTLDELKKSLLHRAFSGEL